jgi:capsular polysaccharide transport system ATP-binding protein
MSIAFENVTLRTRGTIAPVLLEGIDFRIEKGDHFALLAPKEGGLNLVVDVLCGAAPPESGRVTRSGRLSWPLPGASFVHKHQTFIANARFIARLYDVEQTTFISKVIETAAIEEFADERIDFCPQKAMSKFGFALGACLPFDFYLFTGTNVGGRDDKEKFSEKIHELGKTSGLIIATSNIKPAHDFCDKAFVLDPAGSAYYTDMEAAAAHLERISQKTDDTMEETLAPDEDRVFDDFFN